MAYGCSYAVFDKLCLQVIFFMGGYNAKNLNTVSKLYFYCNFYEEVGKEEEEKKQLKSSKQQCSISHLFFFCYSRTHFYLYLYNIF